MTALFGGTLTGCNSQKAEQATVQQQAPAVTQKQIDEIKNNTHMPQAAKDAALARLQQSQAQASALQKAADKAQPK